MDVLTFETCWALNNEMIKQVTSSWSIFIQRLSSNALHISLPVSYQKGYVSEARPLVTCTAHWLISVLPKRPSQLVPDFAWRRKDDELPIFYIFNAKFVGLTQLCAVWKCLGIESTALRVLKLDSKWWLMLSFTALRSATEGKAESGLALGPVWMLKAWENSVGLLVTELRVLGYTICRQHTTHSI